MTDAELQAIEASPGMLKSTTQTLVRELRENPTQRVVSMVSPFPGVVIVAMERVP